MSRGLPSPCSGYHYLPIVICILRRDDTDQTKEEPLLEVIFSQPMLRDLKKLEASQESSQVSGVTEIQPVNKAEKLPDSDQDDRGELFSMLMMFLMLTCC